MLKKAMCVIFVITLFLSTNLIFLPSDIMAAALTPRYKYLYMEEKTFNDLSKAIKQYVPEKVKSSTILTAKLEGECIEEDNDLKELQRFLQKFEMAIHQETCNEKDNEYSDSKISCYYNNQDFAALEYKLADNSCSLEFPGLSEKIITDSYSSNNVYSNFETKYGLGEDGLNKLAKRYLKDVIFEGIPSENVKILHDQSYEGLKCDTINFIINEKAINAVLKALSSEIRKDEDIRKLVKGINESTGESSISEDDITESINKFCDELDEEITKSKKINCEYIAYYNSDNRILGRKFISYDSGTVINLGTFSTGQTNRTFRLAVTDDAKTNCFNIINTFNRQSYSETGDVQINFNNTNIVGTTYSSISNSYVGGNKVFVGDINGIIHIDNIDSFGEDSYYDDEYYNDDENIEEEYTDDSEYIDEEYSNDEVTTKSGIDMNLEDKFQLEDEKPQDIQFSLKSTKISENNLNQQFKICMGDEFSLTLNAETAYYDTSSMKKPVIAQGEDANIIDYNKLTDTSDFFSDIGDKILERLKVIAPDFDLSDIE